MLCWCYRNTSRILFFLFAWTFYFLLAPPCGLLCHNSVTMCSDPQNKTKKKTTMEVFISQFQSKLIHFPAFTVLNTENTCCGKLTLQKVKVFKSSCTFLMFAKNDPDLFSSMSRHRQLIIMLCCNFHLNGRVQILSLVSVGLDNNEFWLPKLT